MLTLCPCRPPHSSGCWRPRACSGSSGWRARSTGWSSSLSSSSFHHHDRCQVFRVRRRGPDPPHECLRPGGPLAGLHLVRHRLRGEIRTQGGALAPEQTCKPCLTEWSCSILGGEGTTKLPVSTISWLNTFTEYTSQYWCQNWGTLVWVTNWLFPATGLPKSASQSLFLHFAFDKSCFCFLFLQNHLFRRTSAGWRGWPTPRTSRTPPTTRGGPASR